ncbi:hypothetical protein JVT61DRAFT_6476 [Boletus reticuloceps]|uniref:Uncharacterized protein n=1 Tax=Boletus reticuloceps TaxID=495285 RepID=A0A8I2YLC2_9AGAM|nr:hypothetical protein JVT61DRAFT_6476 [Boletus reticuloceps]
MQSERHKAASPILRIVTDGHADLRINQHAIPDTRRFASIFPLEVPEAASADCGDASHEEQDDTDDLSRFEFVAALNKNASASQVASVASADQSSTLSAAQQVATRYRAVHGSDHVPERVTTETGERVSQIPDDQRSMYTLAASSDTQSMMDMMWRPKPKVHMCRADQRALMQAQSQAIAMMNNAGLKPSTQIQCRRRGCADILPDVEALKYHLHIHNIADSAAKRNDIPASTSRKPSSLVECSASNSKAPKRSHSRSKSFLGTQHKRLATSPLHVPRKLSAGSLLPSLFSPRESTPEVPEIPSLATVARAFTPDPSTNKPTGLLPVCTYETPSTYTLTPSRGRRKRKESTAVSVDTECSPSIAMLLSPPSSPMMRGHHLVLAPHAKLPVPVALGSTKSDNYVSFQNGSMHSVSEQLMGSRSPMRALSPTRAMSPIRDGIKRILSIGRPDNVPMSEL